MSTLRDMQVAHSATGAQAGRGARGATGAGAAADSAHAANAKVEAALLAARAEAKQHGLCEATDLSALAEYFAASPLNASLVDSHTEGGSTTPDVLEPSTIPPECLSALSTFGGLQQKALATCTEKMLGLDAPTSSCLAGFVQSSAPSCLTACVAAPTACASCSNAEKPKLVSCIAEAAGVRPGCARCMQGFARGLTKFCLLDDLSLDSGCMVNEFLTFRMCTGDFMPRIDLPDDVTFGGYLPFANYEPFQD